MKLLKKISVVMVAALMLGSSMPKAQAAMVNTQEFSLVRRGYTNITIAALASHSLGTYTSGSGLIVFDVASVDGKVTFIAKNSNGTVVGASDPVTGKGTYTVSVPKNTVLYLYISNSETKSTSIQVSW